MPSWINQNPHEDGRICCLCGGDVFRLMHEWESAHPRNSASVPLSVWSCSCGLAFLHPIPTPEQLPEAGDWWTEERKFLKRYPALKRIRKFVQDTIFGGHKERLVRQTRAAMPSGKLLDIGCGTGRLLKIAQKWYQSEGVEPSRNAVEECHRQGFQVAMGFFEHADIPPASYDVAIMDAVLEHVLDPVHVLGRVNLALRLGGVAAIKVPKLFGPAHRMHGREWNGFRVGYHTYLFTGKSLGHALQAAGFDVLKKPRRDRPFDDLLILWGRKVREVDVETVPNAAA